MFRSPRSWNPFEINLEPTDNKKDFVDTATKVEDFKETNMTSTASTTPTTAPSAPATSESPSVDPASHVYGTAKNVWAWGKGVFFISPFLGIAEGVAGKVVSVAGASLEDVDKGVSGKLNEVDSAVLNPAINAIVSVLLGASDKTQETLKPLIESLLKPLGLIKTTAENPEVTPSKPALTTRY